MAAAAPTRRRLSKVLTVADVAREREMSRWSAWRWLRQMEAKHGNVLIRLGGPRGKIVTTVAALRRVDPRWLEDREYDRDEIDELKKSLRDSRAEVRSMKARVRELLQTLEEASRLVQSGAVRFTGDS